MSVRILVVALLCFYLPATSASQKQTPTNDLIVTVAGFEPAVLKVKRGARLQVKRVTEATCATEIIIPDLKINRSLPFEKTVTIDLKGARPGRYRFGCGMSFMIAGELVIE